MKKNITHQEYLTLEGLMHLGRLHYKKMNEYWKAVNNLMDDDSDEISGYIFDDHTIKKILEWGNIEIVEPETEIK